MQTGGSTGIQRPAFLIAIDTEGDNAWSRPRRIETRNALALPRFQQLCERFAFRPTYLVNYEMAHARAFRELGGDVLRRGVAEIGMHMHPWDSPPLVPLGASDWFHQPHPLEYPDDVIARKAAYMTSLLQDVFGVQATSHRAGRWGLNAAYVRALLQLGYRVDCSVTPHVSWRSHPGHPGGRGGADFSDFPDEPYYLDERDIARSGDSTLLEVPMTIMVRRRPLWKEIARRTLGRRDPHVAWLRPNGRNLDEMLALVRQAVKEGCSYIQFTLHSSEFMAGGSPTFRTAESIELLYEHLEILFDAISRSFEGSTLTQFAERFAAARQAAVTRADQALVPTT
jgi:hypothetical protein